MRIWPFIKRYYIHHFLFWIAFFGGWYFFRAKDFPTPQLALQITALKVAVLAILTYSTNCILIPRLLYQKRYAEFLAIYLFNIIAMGLVKLAIIIQMIYPGFDPFYNFKARFYDNIIPLFLLVTAGAAYRVIRDYIQTQRRLNEIAREKAETELQFLKSQINPHFLFNSLNSIYFLIDKENIAARQTLLQFSDLLRYQLYDCNAARIDIEKEIAYLNDYIKLQQIRRDNKYDVRMNLPEDVQGFKIEPLLLIPFVENAFKHISHHANGGNFVHVGMERNNGTFSFQIRNSKEANATVKDPYGGIGLRNVKRRLELLYPEQHTLHIEDSENVFEVNLTLQIENETKK